MNLRSAFSTALLSLFLLCMMNPIAMAIDCKPLEFAELQSLNKKQVEAEYCKANISIDGLAKQQTLAYESDSLKLKLANLNSATGRTSDTSSVGKDAEKYAKAHDVCMQYRQRIMRIAENKKFKLVCKSD